MGTKDKIEFFRKHLDRQIEFFNYVQINNKKKAFLLKMAATLFGILTTVLLGLQVPEQTAGILKNVALITSALVTLFSAADAFFNHRALWIRYTVTLAQLDIVKTELEYVTAGADQAVGGKDIDRLFEKYRSILDETNASWTELRKGTDTNTAV